MVYDEEEDESQSVAQPAVRDYSRFNIDTTAPAAVPDAAPAMSSDYSRFNISDETDTSLSPYDLKMAEAEGDEESFWGDMGASVMKGSAGLAKGAAWLLDQTGFDGAAEGLHGIADNAIDYWDAQISDESKAEMQKKFLTTAEGGDWWNPFDWERPDEGAAGWKTALLMGAESLTPTFAGMGVGAAIAKPLGFIINRFANPLGVAALQTASKAGRALNATDDLIAAGKRADKYLGFINKATGITSFGAGEGLIGGVMTGQSVWDQIVTMDHDALMERLPKYAQYYAATDGLGMPEEERQKQAKTYIADQASSKAGWQAGITTAALGAPAGALYGRILGPIKGGKPFAESIGRGFVKGAALEAAEEAPQSAAEAYIANVATGAPDRGEGVFEAAVSGAVAGAGLGAVFGASGRRSEEAAEKQQETGQRKLDTARTVIAGERAVKALVEKHGLSQEDALNLVDPVAKRFAADGNTVKAVADLRYIEEMGRSRIDAAANEAATSPENDRPEPTEGQQGAGNYKKGHVRIRGMDVSIENPAGSERNGVKVQDHYGYLRGTTAADGDQIDVFISSRAEDPEAPIFVIEQNNAEGEFDEHKVMLGYGSEEEAVEAYKRNYDDDRAGRIRSVEQMDDAQFKEWKTATSEQYQGLKTEVSYETSGTEEVQRVPGAEGSAGSEVLPAVSRGVHEGDTAQVQPADAGAAPEGDLSLDGANSPATGQAEAGAVLGGVVPGEGSNAPPGLQQTAEGGVGLPEASSGEAPRPTVAVGRARTQTPIDELDDTKLAAVLLREEGRKTKTPETETTIAALKAEKERRKRTPFSLRRADEPSLYESQSEGQPPPLRRAATTEGKPAVEADFVHYSSAPNITVLESGRYGTGTPGSESVRVGQAEDPRLKNRVYINVRRGKKADVGEELVQSHATHVYTGKAANLYDINQDALNLKDQIDDALPENSWLNALESLILDEGYSGYILAESGVGVVFNDVPAAYQGKRFMLSERGGFGGLLEAAYMASPTVAFEAVRGDVSPLFAATSQMTDEEKLAFTIDQLSVIVDEGGREDRLAAKVGAPGRLVALGMGAYMGGVTPTLNVSLDTDEQAIAYAQATRLIFDQNATPWFVGRRGAGVTGVLFTPTQPLTAAQLQAMSAQLNGLVNGGYSLLPTGEVVVGNYGAEQDAFEKAIEETFASLRGTIVTVELDGKYHDEKDVANEVKVAASAAGSPDLYEWALDRKADAESRARAFLEGLPESSAARRAYSEVKPTLRLSLAPKGPSAEARQAASERMTAYNKQQKEKRDYLKALRSRPDWAAIMANVDASTAGALTDDEIQEASVEWVMKGVASKYFKRWFADSKTVDQWGQPIKFYHGSPVADIHQFDETRSRSGVVFVSSTPDFASWMAGVRTTDEAGRDVPGATPTVYPVYIRARKIFDFRNDKMMRGLKRALKKITTVSGGIDRGHVVLPLDRVMAGVRTGDFIYLEIPQVIAAIKARGYEAFWVKESGIPNEPKNLGVFDPANIKSAIGNVGTFRPSTRNMLFSLTAQDTPEVFFSPVDRWAEKLTPNQTLKLPELIKSLSDPNSLANKGIKKEEIEDRGVIEALEGIHGTKEISREDLLELLAKSKIVLQEIERRARTLTFVGGTRGRPEEAEDQLRGVFSDIRWRLMAANVSADDAAFLVSEVQTKNDFSVLRDHLSEEDVRLMRWRTNQAQLDLWQAEFYEKQLYSPVGEADMLERAEMVSTRWGFGDFSSVPEPGPTYREFIMRLPSPTASHKNHHWRQDNVIVHLRFHGQFDSSTGKSVLIVEEVQSDLHQEGFRYGYDKSATDESDPVADLPFKNGWAMLGFKRVLRYAVENGYDSVAWTMGEAQKERYNIMGDIADSVTMTKYSSGNYTLTVRPKGARSDVTYGPFSERIASRHLMQENIDKLKAKMDATGTDTATLSGGELEFEGQGLVSFYNHNLKKAVNKYLKKWGAEAAPQQQELRVRGAALPAVSTMLSFPVNDAMRSDISSGPQPMYSLSHAGEFSRRVDLYQMAQWIQANTTNDMRPKALLYKIMLGAERGFYSNEAVRQSGITHGAVITDRTKVLQKLAESVRGPRLAQRFSMSRENVEQELRRVTADWENAPSFVVHDDWRTLPEGIADQVSANGYQNRVEGVMDAETGMVHIVAQNIHTMERLHRVFAEEALGHSGLRKFFGSELDTFLAGVIGDMEGSEGWNDLLAEYPHIRHDIQSKDAKTAHEAKLLAAEELLAKREVSQTTWQKFVAWVREWLRKHGLITNYTDNDLMDVMRRVHENVMSGRTPHAWGQRNHAPVTRTAQGMYSLYGRMLKSPFELAITEGRLDKKSTPLAYLNRLKPGLEKEGWIGVTKDTLAAAAKLQIKTAELDFSGVIAWLKEQHTTNPKKSVTSDEILRVFRATKPRVFAGSRFGRYLFTLPDPVDIYTAGQHQATDLFDKGAAIQGVGYFSEELRRIVADPEALRAIFGANRALTPMDIDLWAPNVLFGNGVTPSLEEYVRSGYTETQIANEFGLKSLNEPIGPDNINAAIRSVIAKHMINKAENDGEFTKVLVSVPLILNEVQGKTSQLGAFYLEVGIMPVGVVRAVEDATGAIKVPDELLQTVQAAVDKRTETVSVTIATTVRQWVLDKIASLPPDSKLDDVFEAINNRNALFSHIGKFTEGSVSTGPLSVVMEHDPSTINPVSGSMFRTSTSSAYGGYALTGGELYDIISIQLMNNPQGPSSESGHYSKYDVVHIRLKTRYDDKGRKILAIEEIQSDWVSQTRNSYPTENARREWATKHVQTVMDALKALNQLVSFNSTNGAASWSRSSLLRSMINIAAPSNFEMSQYTEQLVGEWEDLVGTPLFSNAAASILRTHHPEIAAQLAKAKAEIYELESAGIPNPWMNSWAELAFDAVTALALENGYDAVAWPNAEDVARIYGGDISRTANVELVSLTNGLTVRHQEINVPGTLAELVAIHSADWFVSNSSQPRHGKDSWDVLHEITRESSKPNAEIAKRVIELLDKYIVKFDLSELQAATAGDPDIVFGNSTAAAGGPVLLFKLPEPRLVNAKLHRLTYGQLIPNAARSIDKSAVGRVFIPDTYHEQKRGQKNKVVQGEVSAKTMDDPDELDNMGLNKNVVQACRWLRMFDYDNRYLFAAAVNHHFESRRGDEPFELEGESEGQVEVQGVVFHHARDGDLTFPFEGTITLAVDGNNRQVLDIPVEVYHDNSHGTGLSEKDEMVNAALLYRFAYQVMKKWGIENPNPFAMPIGWIEEMADAANTVAELIETEAVDTAIENAQQNHDELYEDEEEPPDFDIDDVEAPVKELMERAKTEYINNESGDTSSRERDRDSLDIDDYFASSPDEFGAHSAPDFLHPSEQVLDWVREHAVVKDYRDAVLAASVLSPAHGDEDELHRVKKMALDLYDSSTADPVYAEGKYLTSKHILATIAEYQRAPLFRSDPNGQPSVIPARDFLPLGFDSAPPPQDPVYTIDNPQYSEQVWSALELGPVRASGKVLKMPFSLRPAGFDRERAIINKNISRSSGERTVLDRISVWLTKLQDAIHSGDLLWGMKQGFLDDTASIERWEREIFGDTLDASISPYKAMHMTRNLPSVMAAIARAGIPQMRDGAFQPVAGRKGFGEIFRPLYEHKDGDLMELWEGYAAARRSKELITQQNKDGTSREKLFTQQEIADLLLLEQRFPVFADVFDDWTIFNNDLLNLAVDRGVLSAADRTLWAANDYVPFYRALESIENVGAKTGFGKLRAGVSGQHHGIKRLYGSEKQLGNIVENMWLNTASLIDKVYKNEAMTRVVDMLDGIAMKKATLPVEAIRITNAELANALGKAGLLVGDYRTTAAKAANQQLMQSGQNITPAGWLAAVEKMTPAQKHQWATVFRRVKPQGERIVSVMRGGKLEYYEVEDDNVLRTLHGMSPEGLAGLMKAMGFSKSLLTRMITIDPGFMLANWMRDSLSAWVTSDSNFTPVADSIASMADVWNENEPYIKMMMSGAGGGGFYDLNAGNVTKALRTNTGNSAWWRRAARGYMKIGAASENSNRLAIAKAVMARGGTAAEAMHQAQDILNFTMTGDYAGVRFLIRTVPFLNARLQGLYRLYRGGRDNPVGFMLKGLALAAASLALLGRNLGDDDYERLEEWQKDLNWNFFIGGMHFTIPKPFEVGLIFGTLPERLVRGITGHDDLSVSKDRLFAALGETLAFNPIPQLFKPMYEQGANVNLFTGNPIVNMAMSGLEYPYQATPWTSEVAKTIGQLMPDWSGPAQSPLRIEHAIRAYTGTVGLYILNTADWALRQARSDDLPAVPSKHWYEKPVISRIIKGEAATSKSNKYEERLYEAIEASNKALRSINAEAKAMRKESAAALAKERGELLGSNRKALTNFGTGLREIKAKERAIMLHPSLSGDEKRKRLDQLAIIKNNLLGDAAPLLDDIQFKD